MELVDTQDEMHIRNTDLSDSSFEEVDFSAGTFRDVDFSDADFENVILIGTTMRDVTLTGSVLENCSYEATRINGVLLSDLFAAYEKVTGTAEGNGAAKAKAKKK